MTDWEMAHKPLESLKTDSKIAAFAAFSPRARLGPQIGPTLRRRAPLISSQRPYGVWTALRRMAAQLLHLSTTPIGAA